MTRKSTGAGRAIEDLPAQLEHSLRQLSMTVIAPRIEEQIREAEREGPSYAQFLHSVLETELLGRWERKIARRLKRAGLGEVKSLEEFDFSIRPKLAAPQVKQLLDCRYVEEGRCIVCIGRAGTGKTHVAKALAKAACLKGYSVFAMLAADMLDELHASLADGSFLKVFRRYANADLLLVDELGYLTLEEEKASNLFRLVSARHPTRSMIVTSNTGFHNWGRFFPNEAQAMATADRLLDRASVLRFTGKTCREPKEILGAAIE